MNNITYNRKILSPIQPKIKPVIDVRGERHPIRDEVKKFCGTYSITATFEEDLQTLNSFGHIPGLIAILCTFKKDGQLISFGRSCAVFSKWNKYVERTISTAINGAFLSAANNATKVFEALRISQAEEVAGGSIQYPEFQPASEKQKSYLLQLINTNVEDDDEREQLKSKIESINKDQASEMIAGFLNNTINY